VQTVVIINKFDINLENSTRIKEWCQDNNLKLIGKIHFDNIITTEALVRGLPVVEYSNNKAANEIKNIWQKIEEMINE